MSLLTAIRRDILRHRQKAAVLGVLLVVMAVFTIKAVIQLQPQPVAASSWTPPSDNAESPLDPGTAADSEERIRQSQNLWKQLREVRGVDASVAFSFDASFYPLDPARRIAPSSPLDPAPLKTETDAETLRRQHEKIITEQAARLRVLSTSVSGSKPTCIINDQILTLGGTIMGFEVTAIRSRVVDVLKEGVTVAVKMPDDPRGQ